MPANPGDTLHRLGSGRFRYPHSDDASLIFPQLYREDGLRLPIHLKRGELSSQSDRHHKKFLSNAIHDGQLFLAEALLVQNDLLKY